MSCESKEQRSKFLTETVFSYFESSGKLNDKCVQPKLAKIGLNVYKSYMVK